MLKNNCAFFKFFLIISFFVQLSCGKKEGDENNGTEFVKKYDLKSKTVIDSDQLLDPTLIEVLDSVIIICNYKAEPLIEVYDLSGKLLKKAIRIGKGPGEILTIGKIQIDNTDKSFYLDDLFAKKIIKCNLNDFLSQTPYTPIEVFNLGTSNGLKGGYYDKILIASDDLFIAENRSPDGRLVFFNKKGQSLGYHIPMPDKANIDSKLDEFGNASLYASAVTINPSHTKVAMATYSAGMIDLFDIGKKSVIWSYNGFFPCGIDAMPMGDLIVPVHTDEAKTGYLDITSNNQYVYSLYSGRLVEDKEYKYGNIIHAVNWKGGDSFELHLDKDIKRLAVSLDNKTIYGISKNKNEEPVVVSFDISSIKK